jgi:hypothetical protein
VSEGLAALRGLRSAPVFDGPQKAAVRAELETLLARCDWFTLGVMAPCAGTALTCLRQVEAALSWQPLSLDPACEALEAIEGPVFLKGNQTTRRFLVRREMGLGEGLLITGHSQTDSDVEDTWGPLPLDFFGP